MDFFKRVEIKYLLDEDTYQEFKDAIKEYIKPDIYPNSVICNIYFDNDDYELINRSIDKPLYKEKVRLRSYNIPNKDSKVFLEIKQKCYGVVGKRRIEATLENMDEYLYHNKDIDNSFNFKEIDNVIKRHDLKPKIYVAYNREAYLGTKDSNLRITFDSNLRSRTLDLDLSMGDSGKLYFDKPMYIVEIKTLGSIPLYLTNVLSKLKIYPISFSKVGAIYEKGMMNNV